MWSAFGEGNLGEHSEQHGGKFRIRAAAGRGGGVFRLRLDCRGGPVYSRAFALLSRRPGEMNKVDRCRAYRFRTGQDAVNAQHNRARMLELSNQVGCGFDEYYGRWMRGGKGHGSQPQVRLPTFALARPPSTKN